ncbi:toprim domain-containing protein [Pseudacidovorax sp. NFM-22]|uniref:toprim domain-containing protein n=1 Tax=Pseudacidovorax sp. NFM-22 TaxID=2744469 RepID=UPI001F23BB97|nr:toprim domain-containing protein [Pseudacidovorax sp. NFM-22]
MDNLDNVLRQMELFGIDLRDIDKAKLHSLMGSRHVGRRVTCGKGGKHWFKFYLFHPNAGGSYITGSFGSYRSGKWEKVEQDWAPLSEAERARQRREREAQARAAAERREEERRVAAMDAVALWHHAARTGRSPYLERKGLEGECCRYLKDGTLVLLLLRYDLPRAEAVQAAQRILPSGGKYFTKGFAKPGCSLRLGDVGDDVQLVMVVEGYATGLSVRLATGRRWPVYVALDAGNLAHVVPMLRQLHPEARILICADDDWRTRDPITLRLTNPGRTAAMAIARQVPGCDIVYPIFHAAMRGEKDTDFDDLRQRQGLAAVEAQLQGAIRMLERVHGG